MESYTYKNVLEFKPMDAEMRDEFYAAVDTFYQLKEQQSKRSNELKIKEPKIVTKAEPPQPERESRMRTTGM